MNFRAIAVVVSLLAASSAYADPFPIAIAGTEGFPVIVTGNQDVIATYQGNSAAFSNDLLLARTSTGPGIDADLSNDQFIFNNHASAVGSTVNLGSFAVGTELVFRLFVNNTGNSFYSGPASRNPDAKEHARVQGNWHPGETLVSFEDLFGTPEGVNGFNDLSFSFTNTSSSPVPTTPEPASILLVGTGVATAFRRRNNE
jgi:hypothetical protein